MVADTGCNMQVSGVNQIVEHRQSNKLHDIISMLRYRFSYSAQLLMAHLAHVRLHDSRYSMSTWPAANMIIWLVSEAKMCSRIDR